MSFLLDHDVPADVGRVLRYWGHTAVLLKEVIPVTASDEDVFRYAQGEGLKIITCNRDHFLKQAEQAIKAKMAFAGLVILIRRRSRQSECAHLLRLIRQAGESGLSGNINFA